MPHFTHESSEHLLYPTQHFPGTVADVFADSPKIVPVSKLGPFIQILALADLLVRHGPKR
jgi:hypothetical protein